MKNLDDARKLAHTLVDIGNMAGRETKAIVTNMDQPLGRNVGNALEIKEVISFLLSDETTLKSEYLKDLKDVVFEIAAYMVKMAGCGDDIDENKLRIENAIVSRKAYDKFIELVKAQGGHICEVYMDWIGMNLDMPVLKDSVKYMKEIHAQKDGYIVSIDSKKVGEALVCLGGGRNKKDDEIDYAVGFEFAKKVGEKVHEGDTILKVLYNDKEKFDLAFDYLDDAIYIDNIDEALALTLRNKPHVLDIIG